MDYPHMLITTSLSDNRVLFDSTVNQFGINCERLAVVVSTVDCKLSVSPNKQLFTRQGPRRPQDQSTFLDLAF